MVRSLSSAVSELNIISTTTEYANSAAAMHARCLTCDKPVLSNSVTNIRTKTAKARNSIAIPTSALANSRSVASIGYDKAIDEKLRPKTGVDSMFSRLSSPDMNISSNERTRVVTELAIIRSSIDPLPDITVSSIYTYSLVHHI